MRCGHARNAKACPHLKRHRIRQRMHQPGIKRDIRRRASQCPPPLAVADKHPITNLKVTTIKATNLRAANSLNNTSPVTMWDHPVKRHRPRASPRFHVRRVDPACMKPHQHLAFPWFWPRHLAGDQHLSCRPIALIPDSPHNICSHIHSRIRSRICFHIRSRL